MSHPFPVMTTGAFAIYHATTETQAKPIRCARPTVGPPAGTPVSTEVNQGVNAEVTWPVCLLHNVNYPAHFSMKDNFLIRSYSIRSIFPSIFLSPILEYFP